MSTWRGEKKQGILYINVGLTQEAACVLNIDHESYLVSANWLMFLILQKLWYTSMLFGK